MPEVTVLIAVYNAVPFLDTCLRSLQAQTMPRWQAVCVDDASTDGSLALLRKYERSDSRFQVLSLDHNQGQAHARNVALEHAQGLFTCFLDADDWMSPDALQQAVDQADQTGADCVLFDVSYEYADGRQETYQLPDGFQCLTGQEAFRLSLDWQLHGVYLVSTYLHRRFPYDEACRSYSDDNTTRLHYLASARVARCSGVYHYRQHEASTTHAVSVRRFDYLRANESMKKQLVQLHSSQEVLRQWDTIRLQTLVDTYMFYHCHGKSLPKDHRRYGLAEMHRIWRSLDRKLLDRRVASKFGYRPMSSWLLFRLQEWTYFTLRGMAGKNR